MPKTLVMGASQNPSRYAHMAVLRLLKHNNEVVAVGLRSGEINGVTIQKGEPRIPDIHTITMYVGKRNQLPLYNYILSLKPKRVIFNPGAENPELETMLSDQGAEVIRACTLVMLSSGEY